MFGKGRVVLLIIETSKRLAVYSCWGGSSGLQSLGLRKIREMLKKDLFLLQGEGKNDDGASYIAEAIERGAVAIVIDRPLLSDTSIAIPIITVPDCRRFLSYASAKFAGNPSERLTIIAVTGTNGKTTVTHFIGQLLKKLGITGRGNWYNGSFYRWN